MCCTSRLFSLQMYSISSSPAGARVAVKVTVKGLAYAPRSSMVISLIRRVRTFQGVAFDDVELLGVRVTFKVEPEPVVESDGVDDERVSVPSANRVTVPRRVRIHGMRSSVHEDLPVAVNVRFEQEKDVRRRLHDPPRIRRDSRHAARQTIGLWVVFRLPRVHDLLADGRSGIVSPRGSP